MTLSNKSVSQISGQVYYDINASGLKDLNEAGLSGLTIKAYNYKGVLVKETITDSNGYYTLDLPNKKTFRIELENIPTGFYETPQNSLNGPKVQFIRGSKSQNNIGLYEPRLFEGIETRAAVVSYTVGNSKDILGDTISAVTYFNATTKSSKVKLAAMGQVGALWGLAYDKLNEKLYMSAFSKRHVGYGPLGTGGIYMYDFKSNKLQPFISNSSNLSIETGKDYHTGLGGYFNNGNRFNNIDSVFFDKVGTTSFGGLDITEDSKYLLVVNLFTQQLVKIKIPKDTTKVSKDGVSFYSLTNRDYKEGIQRPFAVKVKGDKVYVGIILDASISQLTKDLKAVIDEIDLVSGKTKEVFSMSLDYLKGLPEVGYTSRRGWYPWTNDFLKGVVPESNGLWAIYPQPILSDIEFDTDGSMILGFMDRFGHQGATNAQKNNPIYSSVTESGGDVLRVAFVKGKYILEQNGLAGEIQTLGKDNKQGPGGGEFYYEDFFAPEKGYIVSEETAAGGLALIPSKKEIMVSTREPHLYDWATQLHGVRYYSNMDGSYKGALIIPSMGFQKAYGEGDIENINDAPEVEIGNRVWFDCNENGLQESDEQPIKEVILDLYQGNVLIGTTKTDENGEYHFNRYNLGQNLQIGEDYEIRIALNKQKYIGLRGSLKDVGSNDEIDNDSELSEDGKYYFMRFQIPTSGLNKNSLDFGFKCLELPNGGFEINCDDGVESRNVKVYINQGFNPNNKFDISKGIEYSNELDFLNAQNIPSNRLLFTEKIDPSKNQVYSIRLFNQYCYSDYIINTQDFKQCYEKILGTDEERFSHEINIFPNPAKDIINIMVSGINSPNDLITIKVISIDGKVVSQKSTKPHNDNSVEASFDLSNLPSGTYVVVLESANTVYSKKILKI
jgi:hypothetical protein